MLAAHYIALGCNLPLDLQLIVARGMWMWHSDCVEVICVAIATFYHIGQRPQKGVTGHKERHISSHR